MEMIVDAFAEKLVERLTKVIDEKVIMVLGVKDELQKPRRRMERIARVLKDAERRRIQDEAVKGWVDELKDVIYDADDIIDLCMIQGMGLLQDDHHSPAESSSSSKQVCCCDFSLLSCVRNVPFLYEITDQIKSLNDRLTKISEDKDKFNSIASSNSSDACVVNEPSSLQSSSLLEPDIVGWEIRDATKSLVELLVSPHEEKCHLFAIIGMGGIGKTTLAQQIYNDSNINDHFVLHSWIWVSKSATSMTNLLKEIIRNVGDGYGESTTIAELQKILSNVLHGKSLFLVLDDVWDVDVWIGLIKNSIQIATTKCRVLVTTRDRNTALKMGATHIHNVSKLSLDFGWELLCKKDIGMQIIEKCNGLPVAISAIASVLVTKDRNKREWENVLNKLRGALYLSYETLPSALKQCFLYCSLKAKNREFDVNELVPEWIAEGYIKPNGNASMEEVAKDYYMELIRRSFLQPNPFFVDILAQALASDESFLGDPEDLQIIDSIKKARHLTVSSKRESVSLHGCKFLRILPRSITKLCNLRRLILHHTPLNYVPKGIGKLEHLNYLSGFFMGDNGIDKGEGCDVEDLQMLKNLSYLSIMNLEKAKGKSALVLSNKPHLRELRLRCTPNTSGNIQQHEMDKIAQIFDEICPPPSLELLIIRNFFGGQFPKWMPSTSIGSSLLELTSLTLSHCYNRPQLPQLGQLSQLKYLKIHVATAVASIGPEFLGNGEPAENAFPKLEYLLFSNMTNWEEWSLISGAEDIKLVSSKLLLFPHLISISITNCPKLKALRGGLNHIQNLYIKGVHNLSRVSDLSSFSLRELEVVDCPMLECVEKLESLQSSKMTDKERKSLPEWLISFLQQHEKPHDNQFHLYLNCSAQALKGCLKGRPYWVFLQQVPRLGAYAENKSMYLKYTKEPFSYQTNLDEDINWIYVDVLGEQWRNSSATIQIHSQTSSFRTIPPPSESMN
ncbi:P-loop containing nucleoside triphosphate hydrolase protein [Dioscorea alata]|uniref:P-loop containing nucleoside triphosphate hydrolase protein n=1 Tax=Dioscorea alata TaxID=55571 RepID=A0ACB7U623_DIOAL|nr:P-loop containing nucleoside triphosphate hydrolase protein [Dioscorea alata]